VECGFPPSVRKSPPGGLARRPSSTSRASAVSMRQVQDLRKKLAASASES
jgi:hypothetical protein